MSKCSSSRALEKTTEYIYVSDILAKYKKHILIQHAKEIKMKVKIGFLKFEEGEDDIYPLPTLAIGYHKSLDEGFAIGFGIKFIKLIFSIGFLFPNNRTGK